mgnify:CR=1 FL=1
MELSKKIKQIRNDNKLTQEQFAEKMLVSRTAVSKWENGTCYPSIDSLKYMSQTFNVSLDKLLSSEEILEIAKTENQSNISKYNGLLFCLLDVVRIIFMITNTKVEYVGKENVPNETFVCYANHKSAMDVFLTHYGLNSVCSVIGKKSLFKYPVIKDFQYTFGCIALDRENDRAAAKNMIEAMRNIKNGLSYIIFPEGTRNKTEEGVLKAREGAFKLVTKTGVPLLPCTIIGSEGYSKRKTIFKRVKVKVIFHKPIYSEEYMQFNTTEISNQVMEIIKKDLN